MSDRTLQQLLDNISMEDMKNATPEEALKEVRFQRVLLGGNQAQIMGLHNRIAVLEQELKWSKRDG